MKAEIKLNPVNDIMVKNYQTVTSAGTSLNQVPYLFKSPAFHDLAKSGYYYGVYDIGAGKYNKTLDYILDRFDDLPYMPFDPYNRPEWENKASQHLAEAVIEMNFPLIVTCSNVLNVLDSDEAIKKVCEEAAYYASNDGVALFTVYRGSGTRGEATYTARGFQRNQDESFYIPFIRQAFGNILRKGRIIKAW